VSPGPGPEIHSFLLAALCVEIVKKGSVGKSCESHLQNTFSELPLLSLNTFNVMS
jgi:hypothetical protein